MENAKTASGSGVNRAKTYQLVLFTEQWCHECLLCAYLVLYCNIWKQCTGDRNGICFRYGYRYACV